MADGRRIIFGTHLVPKESADMEESTIQKWSILRSVGKTLGGKGTISESEMQANQWSDSWTSMAHSEMNWEDWDDATAVSGNRWEDVNEAWNGETIVLTHGVAPSNYQLSKGHASATDKDLAFIYVKNTGSVQCFLSCTPGGASGFNTVIPPGGSVNFRGGGSAVHCDDIYVKTIAGTTTIEYILATSET